MSSKVRTAQFFEVNADSCYHLFLENFTDGIRALLSFAQCKALHSVQFDTESLLPSTTLYNTFYLKLYKRLISQKDIAAIMTDKLDGRGTEIVQPLRTWGPQPCE